jgi:hypothetical protein
MTYAQNNSTLAADLNSLAGTSNATTAYASSAAATQKVAALLGVGFGDRGYGQTTPLLNPVAVDGVIYAADWLNLRNAIATIAAQQGTATTLLPPASDFVAGATIKSYNPATSAYDFATMIANIDTNRFNTNGGASLSATLNALTVTRASSWGDAGNGIIAEVTATFPSEDAARYFFNSGGALTMVLSHPSVASTQDSNWNTILSALGTISLAARSSARSGSLGTVQAARGFYNLTGAYQNIFDGTNIGTGAYAANDVMIDALVQNVVGANGGNGTVVKFRIALTDAHTNAFSDLVQSGTKAAFGFNKATVALTGISSPTFATTINF